MAAPLLKPKPFAEFLSSNKDRKFIRRMPGLCPVACYLKQGSKKKLASAWSNSYKVDGIETSYTRLFKRFIRKVDSVKGEFITGKQALRILNGLK